MKLKEIGGKILKNLLSVHFFKNQKKKILQNNFDWEYVLVEQ